MFIFYTSGNHTRRRNQSLQNTEATFNLLYITCLTNPNFFTHDNAERTHLKNYFLKLSG